MHLLNQVQKIALYIFFFSINFEIWLPSPSSTYSVARITGMFYLVTILPQLPYFLKIDNLRTVLLPVLLFFGLLTFNNLINANALSDTVFNQPIFLNILIFWLMINHVRKDYMLLEKGMLWFAMGTILLTLFYILRIGVSYDSGRISIFGENQNNIGLKVSAALIIMLLLVVQNRLQWGWYRFLLLIPMPFMLRLIAETGSRVSVISFALAFAIGVVLIKTGSIWNKIVILVGGVMVFIFIGIQFMQSEILMDRLSSTSQTGDLGGRDLIWKKTILIIKDNPVFGVGDTGYALYANESPHNVILEVLCYTGLIGLTIFFIFLYQTFIRGYRSYLKNDLLLPMLLISPVMGMILSGQILNTKIGWVIFAYIVGSSALKYDGLENDYKLIK